MGEQTIVNINELRAAVRNGLHPEYLFFWSHQSKDGQLGRECLSQWYSSSFTVDGVHYPSAEHFMMAEKARLFGDEEIRQQILHAKGPDEAKKLGKLARNFDEKTWVQHRFDLIVRGNAAKFRQNDRLKKYLVSTGEKILVEASPYDTVWGIGLAEHDRNAANPEMWKGLNLLGFALMAVRSGLREEAPAG